MDLLTIILFVVGAALLVGGAELLVRGASAFAVSIGISRLVVGLTVVAFGTSAPELAVGVRAGLFGQPGETDIALGNVVGSNTANILLILGCAAIFSPLLVQKQLLNFDLPLMIAVSVLVTVMSLDSAITWLDGLVLFLGVIAYTVWSIYKSQRDEKEKQEDNPDVSVTDEPATTSNLLKDAGFMVVGLVMLVLGSDWLVVGAQAFARALGISELIIGLTIVAVGTSLPELATTIAATIKGEAERDLAVGNAIGSNIFNILLILGATSLVAPQGIPVRDELLAFDYPVMIIVALVCMPVFYTDWKVTRLEGGIFLGYYAAYVLYLILLATEHSFLPTFQVIAGIAVLMTIALFLVRAARQLFGLHEPSTP